MVLNEALRAAIIDYRHLLDRGYPVQATIKLVGDRYRLDRAARIILFRGVLDEETSATIASRIVLELPQKASLCIDGYNVLFTLANYRAGRPLFMGTDGLLRDAGGSHGRFATGTAFAEALETLVDALPVFDPDRVVFYLDAPVSTSHDHAAAIRNACGIRGIPAEVRVVSSADPCVIGFDGDAVASSDSVVALRAKARVFDLARNILEQRFGVSVPDLRPVIKRVQ
ncbi:MAG TPA: DUF434 domain-containing protein [bacterium]|nr:DUF434 domain-containing protein [bacterium]